jgi:hypothetical protein
VCFGFAAVNLRSAKHSKEPAQAVVKDIRRATRKHYSAEEKTRIVLESLRGEDSIEAENRRYLPQIAPRPFDHFGGR